MQPVDDAELKETIAYALWRNGKASRKRPSLDEARAIAAKITDHMDRCRLVVSRKELKNLHSTHGECDGN